jgi:hypothetical protein
MKEFLRAGSESIGLLIPNFRHIVIPQPGRVIMLHLIQRLLSTARVYAVQNEKEGSTVPQKAARLSVQTSICRFMLKMIGGLTNESLRAAEINKVVSWKAHLYVCALHNLTSLESKSLMLHSHGTTAGCSSPLRRDRQRDKFILLFRVIFR